MDKEQMVKELQAMGYSVTRRASEINSPDELAEKFSDIKDKRQEHFKLLTMNIKNEVIAEYIIGIGDTSFCPISIKQVMYHAIMDNASCIAIGHNHPSGCSDPSSNDLDITRNIFKIANLMDVQLIDHLIVCADGSYTSLREQASYLFTDFN